MTTTTMMTMDMTTTMTTMTFNVRTVIEDGHAYRVLTLTDEQRSMIASAFVAGISPTPPPSQRDLRRYNRWRRAYQDCSLCCAVDRAEAVAAIVGEEFSDALWELANDGLGCCYIEPDREQKYLDMIANLDELRYEVVN